MEQTARIHLKAFGDPGEYRDVRIPEGVEKMDFLEACFYYGQNDVQPQPHPSASVGDVIEKDGMFWRIEPCGFAYLGEKLESP